MVESRGGKHQVDVCSASERASDGKTGERAGGSNYGGLTRTIYQRTNAAPKNIHASAPRARYGPNGSFADQTRLPTSSVANPTSEPASDPANTLKSTARQPRNAPIAARNLKSPRPIASRGITTSIAVPEISLISSSISVSPSTVTRL